MYISVLKITTLYVYMCMYMCACMYAYACVCIHTYIPFIEKEKYPLRKKRDKKILSKNNMLFKKLKGKTF